MADIPRLDDPRKDRLLQWLLTAPAQREPSTKKALSGELGVSDRTLRDWEADPSFETAWRLGFKAVAGSTERTKAIMDQLYSDATDATNDRRVQAAKQYWDMSKALAPPEPEVQASRHAQSLTDDELRRLIAEASGEELEARQEKPVESDVA